MGDKQGYQETLEELWSYLSDIEREQYHVSGFSHPHMVVQVAIDPKDLAIAQWGLIPGWTKDHATAEKFWNNTLNARGETIFEKPSFKDSAKNKRCVIVVDAFYEHHHFDGKAYPFLVQPKQNGYFLLAGLWSEWLDKETGELRKTFTIVTTEAHSVMARIHNNPKQTEPRMPVILDESEVDVWFNGTQEQLETIIHNRTEGNLKAHSVRRLRGKEYIGNCPEITEAVVYSELALDPELQE